DPYLPLVVDGQPFAVTQIATGEGFAVAAFQMRAPRDAHMPDPASDVTLDIAPEQVCTVREDMETTAVLGDFDPGKASEAGIVVIPDICADIVQGHGRRGTAGRDECHGKSRDQGAAATVWHWLGISLIR